jgi:hypothetical protein
MTDLFRIQIGDRTLLLEDLRHDDWRALEAAAGFQPCCGRSSDSVVADDRGELYIIDTCGQAHAVDPAKAMGVRL